MKEFPENFCILPWISAIVPPLGGVGICCVSSSTLLNEGADASQLGTIRNNQSSREFRKEFLNGQWPKACEFCKKHSGPENIGHDMRRMMNHKYKLHENYKPEDFTEAPLELLDLEMNFGNICNFKCRMCSANNSTKWISDAQLLKDERFHPLNDLKAHKGEYDIDRLIPFMNKLQLLQVKGGEPFLHPQFKKLLQALVSAGVAKNCGVYVITNGSVYDPEILDLIAQFSSSHVAISIDGIEPIYSYIRDGSSGIDQVVNHIHSIMSKPKIYFSINYTLQIYNMLQVYETTKFFSEFSEHIILLPVMQDYLHFRNAPQEIKDDVAAQLQRVLEEIELTPESYQRYNSALLNLREPRSEEAWSRFVSYTTKLDLIRNQNFLNLEPRFRKYFAAHEEAPSALEIR